MFDVCAAVSGGESGTSAAAAAAFMAKAGHVHQSSRHDDMNIMNENPSSAKLSGAQSHGQQSSRHGGSGKSTGGHGAKQQQMQQHFEQHNDEQQLQQQHRHEKLQLQQVEIMKLN